MLEKHVVLAVLVVVIIMMLIWLFSRKDERSITPSIGQRYKAGSGRPSHGYNILMKSTNNQDFHRFFDRVYQAFPDYDGQVGVKKHNDTIKYEIYFHCSWDEWYAGHKKLFPGNRFRKPDTINDLQNITVISMDVDEDVVKGTGLSSVNIYSFDIPSRLSHEYTYFRDGSKKLRGKSWVDVPREKILTTNGVPSQHLTEACGRLGIDEVKLVSLFYNDARFAGNRYPSKRIELTDKGHHFGGYIMLPSVPTAVLFLKDFQYPKAIIDHVENNIEDGTWFEMGIYVRKRDPTLTPLRTGFYTRL